MTNKQRNDIECIKYFIPEVCRAVSITDEDIKMFLEYSDKGLHKDKVGEWQHGEQYRNGFNALIQGKRWRGIHIHEMYEEGVLDGTMPYFTILGGYTVTERRKWWQFWKKKYTFYHIPIPRVVVDFLKKEMFKGQDADTIEKCYQEINKK
jgi:hypothetical protein